MALVIHRILTAARYIRYNLIHDQGMLVSFARSVTGTVKTSPMILAMCALLACAPPCLLGPLQVRAPLSTLCMPSVSVASLLSV